VGIDSRWYVIEPDAAFFQVTKKLHHCLQGDDEWFSDGETNLYISHNREAAACLDAAGTEADLWIIHDAQVVPFRNYSRTESPAVWVCHLDTTKPGEHVRQMLLFLLSNYERIVFSMPEYRLEGVDPAKVSVIPPAIDPLSPKNQALPRHVAKGFLARLGIDLARPLVTQVSRFDRWKDPWGVIDAYRLVKEGIPELQLALVGAMTAKDDPEAVEVFDAVKQCAQDDPDIHLFSSPDIIGDLEVGAFQCGSEVIVQKSLREGFGLTVTEAMWKGTPVVGGDCGGIRQQITDGETGFLVKGAQDCAQRIVELVKNRELARRMGEKARESVRKNYLMPRLLRDYLELALEVLTTKPRALKVAV
ncbi:MAG: glycosyltransferase, partial [Candidatus Binatia bacterium]